MSTPSQETINQFVGAAHGDFPTVKSLLAQHPALLNAAAAWGETAIQAAAQVGRVDIAEFLLTLGAPLDICTAAMLGQKETVAAMLAADPHAAQSQGAHGIPLMYFAVIGGRQDIAEMLLSAGASVNGGEGVSTPLHGAVMFNQAPLAAWLISQGADLAAKNFEGKTALESAEASGHADIIALLGGSRLSKE